MAETKQRMKDEDMEAAGKIELTPEEQAAEQERIVKRIAAELSLPTAKVKSAVSAAGRREYDSVYRPIPEGNDRRARRERAARHRREAAVYAQSGGPQTRGYPAY